MEQVFADYLKTLTIPVSRRYFRKRVASHPDYPSLLSISDTLYQLGIPHGVARLEKEQLGTLNFPYVLHMDKGSGEFLVVHGEEDLNTKVDLLKDWSGIVLQAEAPEELEDDENRDWLGKEKAGRFAVGLLILSVLIIIAAGWTPGFNWAAILVLVTAIAGAVLGYFLVAKDLGIKYDTVESFCNSGKKTNCDRVLRSDEATLFGHISLSDAVLSYFTAQLIVAGLLIPLAVSAAPLWLALAVTSVLTLPVVAYSLYLQGIKFKTWCRLCLMVAGVLVVQAVLYGWLAASGMFGLTDVSLRAAGLVAGNVLAVCSLVFLLKTRLKDGNVAEQAMAAANRIKFNPSVLTHLLLQQPKADCTLFEQELLIGNREAPVLITMAASLGCGPCKDGFEKAKRLVRMYPEKVNLSVRFSIPQQPNGNETDPGQYILGYWIRRIYGTKQQSGDTENLLQDWFELADLSQFREKYPYTVNGETPAIETLAARYTGWFDKAEIKGTPTFFVNGFKLPGQYRVEDLRYLVAGFSEQIPVALEMMKEAK